MKNDNDIDYKNKIKQSRELPKTRYHLELTEQKVILCFFGQLKQNEDAFSPQEIFVDDIAKYCGFEEANIYRTIKRATKTLSKAVIEYRDRKDYSYVPWFRYISYKNGYVSYQLNDAIKTELLKLYENNKIYISIDPCLIPKFTSNYGLRLYLILKGDIASHKTNVSYSIAEICFMLSLPNAYDPEKTDNASANQRKNIIEPSIKEINEVSDINVEYEPIKRTRRVIGWKFTFHPTVEAKPEEISYSENYLSLPQANSHDNTDEDTDKKWDLAKSLGLESEELVDKINKASTWSDIIQIAKENKSMAMSIIQYSQETKKKQLAVYKRRYREIMNKDSNYYDKDYEPIEYDLNQILSALFHGFYQILVDPVAENDKKYNDDVPF